MIDIHNHILPGIDDGASSYQTTLNMLKIASKDGTSTIVATPHYYYPYFIGKHKLIDETLEFTNKLCKKNNINIEILPGMEVKLDDYTLEAIQQGYIKTINNSQYLLIELSMNEWKPNYLNIIYELKLMGYEIIIAHPERYRYIQNDITMVNPLIKEGVVFQINSSSINGLGNKSSQKTAIELIKQGAAHLIASDAHSDRLRSPVLKDALTEVEKLETRVASNMREYPYKILKGENIRLDKVQVKQRNIFSFLSQSS